MLSHRRDKETLQEPVPPIGHRFAQALNAWSPDASTDLIEDLLPMTQDNICEELDRARKRSRVSSGWGELGKLWARQESFLRWQQVWLQ